MCKYILRYYSELPNIMEQSQQAILENDLGVKYA